MARQANAADIERRIQRDGRLADLIGQLAQPLVERLLCLGQVGHRQLIEPRQRGGHQTQAVGLIDGLEIDALTGVQTGIGRKRTLATVPGHHVEDLASAGTEVVDEIEREDACQTGLATDGHLIMSIERVALAGARVRSADFHLQCGPTRLLEGLHRQHPGRLARCHHAAVDQRTRPQTAAGQRVAFRQAQRLTCWGRMKIEYRAGRRVQLQRIAQHRRAPCRWGLRALAAGGCCRRGFSGLCLQQMVAASDAQIGGQQDALLEHFHLDDFDPLSRSHEWLTSF